MDYDLIVLGAGPGGYPAAFEAAKNGLKTAVVELSKVGGTCLHEGCIPTKTFIHAAEIYENAREGEPFGVHAHGLSVDLKALQAYKNEVVDTLSGNIVTGLKKAKIDLYWGRGIVTGEHTLRVEAVSEAGQAPDEAGEAVNEVGASADVKELTFDNLLIATGSEPVRLRLPGMDLEGVLDSTAILQNDELPESLTIIGGGVIGMEFASLYATLGSRVTVIEALDRILANLDREFSQSLKLSLKKKGVDIHTGAMLKEIKKAESGLTCVYEEKGATCEVTSEKVLVAVGRRPVSAGLFEGTPEPEMERGRILVNNQYETSRPGVYAIGDVIGGVQLAHAATAEGLNAVAAMLGKAPAVSTKWIPSCVYVTPEMASVGMTEEEAKTYCQESGIELKKLKYVMSANGKTVLTRQERGFIKVLAEKTSGKILGCHMMCARATDMIGEFSALMANNGTITDLQKAIRPHPTFNEAVWELAREF